jgi:hypothetical protein
MSQMTLSQMSITETTASPQHKLHWLAEQALNCLVVAGPRPPVADGVMAPSTDRIKWICASPLFEYGTCRRFQGFADRQKVSQMS